MQFVTSASFLLTVYSDYLASSGGSLHCAAGTVPSYELLSFAKSQVNYILQYSSALVISVLDSLSVCFSSG